MRENRTPRQAGFTILEILVVAVMIGMIVSIALVSLANALDKGRQRATMADMRTISKAIESYMTDHRFPPATGGGIESLVSVLQPQESSVLPVRDHWRRPYHYVSDRGGNYTLESFGKDGVDGSNISAASRFNFDLDIVLSNGVFVAAPE